MKASDGTELWKKGRELIVTLSTSTTHRRKKWLAQQITDAYITKCMYRSKIYINLKPNGEV